MRSRHVLPAYRIAIVGAGAIGCYYGGKLAQFGRDVHFLFRGDYETVRKRGLRIRSKGENIHVAKVQAYRSPNDIGPSDLVIIAVKTTANAELPALVGPLLGEKTIILTLQNGLGNEEILAAHFGAERILGAVCYIGVNRVEPGVIERTGGARLTIGEFCGFPQPRLHDIAWEFKRCGVLCSVTANLARERWRKLVWNIPFNGLTITAGGVDTARVTGDDKLRLRALALMDEIIAVANFFGHKISTAEGIEWMKRTEKMEPYKPSTLIAFLAGRPLEIEAIWGEPLRRAREAGVPAPQLEKLYTELNALDAA